MFSFYHKNLLIGNVNGVLQVDISVLCHGPVLCIISVRTSLQNAGFIRTFDSEGTWKQVRKFWKYIYAKTSDVMHMDAGINFSSLNYK